MVRRKRLVGWPWLGIVLALLLSGSAGWSGVLAQGQSGRSAEAGAPAARERPFTVPNPGADLWRTLRRAESGQTQAAGTDAGVLINASGERWRQLRNERISRYGGWFLFLLLLTILAFHVLHGPVRLEKGRSGRRVRRWSGWERVLHWYVAGLFVILALTGLSLLFGRALVIPLIGNEAFGAYAIVAKNLHNYLGPLFVIGVVLVILVWARYNLPKLVDLLWIVRGGGILGSAHPSAGRMNGGEKIWFWFIATVGLVACASGLLLDFPDLVGSRNDLQLAHVVHAAATVVWVGIFFGHAYIGTLGTEGALEGMTRGEVDVNWAEQHHDLWLEEVRARREPSPPREGAVPGALPQASD